MGARGIQGPIIAVTGTPGTGKTTACRLLAEEGEAVLGLARYADDPRFTRGADAARSGTTIIDEEAIEAHLAVHLATELPAPPAGDAPVFIESHFAHELRIVDRILVLRCSPRVLRTRLATRGWSDAKIRENLEAEALDLILQEAIAVRDEAAAEGRSVAIGEIDTTHKDAAETARHVRALASVEALKLEIGHLDWSDEVLEWY